MESKTVKIISHEIQCYQEADYTLDDSFWNEESPVGEVERLLREYRQNQELVRNIGAHYYQIIYPVQLRHHEKMGISTREVNTQKNRRACMTRVINVKEASEVCKNKPEWRSVVRAYPARELA
ncbi:hypothetical protein K1T71_003653 [Dendrolimus kikuchii]|uniref:Uncharacterized protein n=1 Tax=Dendrolimus kikuchii TaxID=765133 RepID=A0ACC1D912_9NEOP|nr:hypothetical protein K1T71_003653 [Dendrolimus kikuchii]